MRRSAKALRDKLNQLIDEELRTQIAIKIVRYVQETVSSRLPVIKKEKEASVKTLSIAHRGRQLPQLPVEVISKILELVPGPRDNIVNWWPHMVLGPSMRLRRIIAINRSHPRAPSLALVKGLDCMDLEVTVTVLQDKDIKPTLDDLLHLIQYPHRWKKLNINTVASENRTEHLLSILNMCKPSLQYLEELRIGSRTELSVAQTTEAFADTTGEFLKTIDLHSDLFPFFHRLDLLCSVQALTLRGKCPSQSLYVLSELQALRELSLDFFSVTWEQQESGSRRTIASQSLRSLQIHYAKGDQLIAYLPLFASSTIEHFGVVDCIEGLQIVFGSLDEAFPCLRELEVSFGKHSPDIYNVSANSTFLYLICITEHHLYKSIPYFRWQVRRRTTRIFYQTFNT